MKTKLFLSAFLLTCSIGTIAQPSIEWQRCLGSTANDWAYSVRNTQDGGYIATGFVTGGDGDVTGYHVDVFDKDMWVVKLDANGALQWQKSLGGTIDETGYAIRPLPAGGYIVAGVSNSTDGDVTGQHGISADAWVVRLNDTGGIVWAKCYGGTNAEGAQDIELTTDGGYIFAGNATSTDGDVTVNHGGTDMWVVKLDSAGAIQWQTAMGGSGDDWANKVIQTADGGYLVAGGTESLGGDVTVNKGAIDYWVVKLSSTGAKAWQKTYGGPLADEAMAVCSVGASNYLIAGYSASFSGDVTGHHGPSSTTDYWLLNIDDTGAIQWEKSLGGTNNDVANAVVRDADSGFTILGSSASSDSDVTSNHGGNDFWLVHIDTTGNIIWQKNYGSGGDDEGYDVQQITGGYVMAGMVSFEGGDVTGIHPGGQGDYWITKVTYATGLQPITKNGATKIFPNPSHNMFNVAASDPIESYAVYDMAGRLMTAENKVSARNVRLDATLWPDGAYEAVIQFGAYAERRKLLKY